MYQTHENTILNNPILNGIPNNPFNNSTSVQINFYGTHLNSESLSDWDLTIIYPESPSDDYNDRDLLSNSKYVDPNYRNS